MDLSEVNARELRAGLGRWTRVARKVWGTNSSQDCCGGTEK
ncbi:hypothetical protein [Nocardia testacea]